MRAGPGRHSWAALAGLAALILASCSSASSSPGGASVNVVHSRLGAMLVDRSGRTLYLFGSDKPGRSLCTAACARVWPPATTAAPETAGAGVDPAKLGAIARADRTLQLAYGGHPLYTFSGDTGTAQINGEGFLGTWFVVSPFGRSITVPGAAAAPAGY
ncbi:MAG: COG4315 family predicted lipoprotein [Solirubrobacteraceae bacterium]